MSTLRRLLPLFFGFLLTSFVPLFSQTPPTGAPGQNTPEQKKPVVSAASRLLAARTLFLRRPRGNTIPYDVIITGFEGWGRFALVNDETKADLIIEITAPEEGGGGFSVSGSTTANNPAGAPEQTSKSRKDFSNASVRMVVLDARTKTPLWMDSAQPKSAMRRRAQEDNQVEAAQKLFSKFHDRIEPPPPSQ